MHKSFERSSRFSQGGFSLVEVVISLGIVGFAFVALLGLMPVGLSTLRDAMNSTTEGMIVKQLAYQARQGNFTNLEATYGGQILYYDEDGTGLTEAQSAQSYFRISTSVRNSDYPGATVNTASPISRNLKTLHIEITVAPNGVQTTTKRPNSYNILIPNFAS